MKDDVYAKMLSRFITVYGEPKTDDPVAFLEEYARAIDGFDSVIIEEAATRVMRTHEYPTWPTLGEIIGACRMVAYERDPPRVEPLNSEPKPVKDPVAPERLQELLSSFSKSLSDRNAFEDIVARCPIGGKVNVSAPWGEEVTDRNGNIVPIRKRRGEAA